MEVKAFGRRMWLWMHLWPYMHFLGTGWNHLPRSQLHQVWRVTSTNGKILPLLIPKCSPALRWTGHALGKIAGVHGQRVKSQVFSFRPRCCCCSSSGAHSYEGLQVDPSVFLTSALCFSPDPSLLKGFSSWHQSESAPSSKPSQWKE